MERTPTGANVHDKIQDGLLLGPVNEIIAKSPKNILAISAGVLAGYLALIAGLAYCSDSAQAEKSKPVTTDK